VSQLEKLIGMSHEKDMQANDQVHEATLAAAQPMLSAMPEYKSSLDKPLKQPTEV
jgi:hypothetical protein